MTVDTASLRASGKLWGDNYGYLTGHQIVAIADALDEERERVRVLTAALREIYAIDETTADDCDAVIRMVDCAMAALATAGGEGVTT